MDATYTQHRPSWRRKSRSGAGLDSLSLAPLTTRLPLRNEDYEAINSASSLSRPHTSYLYGRSAPTTPRLLSHSPPPSRPRRPARGASVPYTPELGALAGNKHHYRPSKTAAASPAAARKRRSDKGGGGSSIFPDTDFLLHVGALIASEARDAKGQGWLVTRASSTTSLPVEPENYRARGAVAAGGGGNGNGGSSSRSAWNSRRGSRDFAAAGARGAASVPFTSPAHSRFASRSQSQASLFGGMGNRTMTPEEMRRADMLALTEDDPKVVEDYFSRATVPTNEDGTMPTFVGLDEALEYGVVDGQDEQETLAEAEEYVRELMKNRGILGWLVDKMSGREDSHVEDEPAMEEYEADDYDAWKEAERDRQERRSASLKRLQECTIIPLDCTNDPPPKEDQGILGDASWLLKVAAKALFA
ncbi:hypothetical protein MYCTH_2312721 [Thermothelomyces thermophilus ATCC 42464]|uniref:Uncharacterized protein n=1 Tax=Thermothelomyces thermophilus (strain ATCC 42464 / BCRC 31852 / DSM 1799) TaxID=573729 RepID=G2QN58_THET4|nr:uncharacterized protein MYCTH_2312721 [Thermothelomyces thermophilus ATCC 42464]AEO61931.1 hypothetical protein MYCTH_2312721 [Thermothelomyces thermophilus ATCC 42464]